MRSNHVLMIGVAIISTATCVGIIATIVGNGKMSSVPSTTVPVTTLPASNGEMMMDDAPLMEKEGSVDELMESEIEAMESELEMLDDEMIVEEGEIEYELE